jgi:hypothetical protein
MLNLIIFVWFIIAITVSVISIVFRMKEIEYEKMLKSHSDLDFYTPEDTVDIYTTSILLGITWPLVLPFFIFPIKLAKFLAIRKFNKQ